MRLWQHQEGVSSKAYTYTRRPVKLVWCSEEVARYSHALSYERQIKGWSRAKKEALIRGDYGVIHAIVSMERRKKDRAKKKPSR